MKNIIFFRISGFDATSIECISEHLSTPRGDDQEGISVKDYGVSFLNGIFWVKKKRKITYFSLEQQQYIEDTIDAVDTADIRLEINKNLLVIIGSKRMAQRCVTTLSILLENAVTVSERTINLPAFCRQVIHNTDVELLKAYLKDIPIADGILVSCNCNLKNVDDTSKFISKYSDSIISIQLFNKNTNSTVTIKQNGSITVGRVSDDDFDALLDALNAMLDKE